ncbi:DUF1772 domain-containing protein [uncultured Hymenobacter sp.]|uniref:anthrone oxygenase family protein n=1 Tax=uncultured Hymenobacter sp. TaxID=170016 RepID=UPI0035C97222
MQGKPIVLALATVATGLVAGVYYGFSVAVNPGLARLPAPAYIAAMQAINDVIQNPVFAASFFGAPLLLPLATVLYARRPYVRRFRLLTAATGLFWASLGVTVAANIPLNETLATFSLPNATPAQAAVARAHFAGPWNKWHGVRTLASTLA